MDTLQFSGYALLVVFWNVNSGSPCLFRGCERPCFWQWLECFVPRSPGNSSGVGERMDVV
eukprot:13923817-Alexandrium_andersonii.AAC.1